jgi:hypothetical protein
MVNEADWDFESFPKEEDANYSLSGNF